MDLSHERLLELLHYDPTAGVFTWRVAPRYRIRVGDRAGNANRSRPDQPYWNIMIGAKNYRAGRLAWLYMMGTWPDKEIDHRNGNPLDDAWDNLRLATSAQNKANQRKRRDNNSGFKGVHPHGKHFYARARVGGSYLYLGMFSTAAEAAKTYKRVTSTIHGEFARHD